jgi:hypothetical protein
MQQKKSKKVKKHSRQAGPVKSAGMAAGVGVGELPGTVGA